MSVMRLLIGCLFFVTAVQANAQKEPSGFMPRLDVLVHVESLGDMNGHEDSWVGTKGRSLRAEGLQINTDREMPDLSVEYMCHLEGTGDSPYRQEGEFCGTRGEARRMEGFAIRLTGPAAEFYDVEYQCHIAWQGDSQLFRDGQYCGTRGQSREIQAVLVRIVRR